MKILAIGAHYDDIEIGCGGTLIKHIENNDDVYFAITSSDEFRTGSSYQREQEQRQVFRILNLNCIKLKTYSYKQDVNEIIGHLDLLKPDLVFTQYYNDTHQDHKRCSIIGEAVGRKRTTTTVFYDSGSSYDFQPNVYSVIDFDRKMHLLNCFQSQISCGAISLDIIKRKNHYWASLISDHPDKYAEGFMIRKMKWRNIYK